MIRLKRLKRPAWAIPTPESTRSDRLLDNGTWRIALVIAAIVVIAGVFYWWWQGRWIVTTGRVIAKEVMITAPMTGRLVAIPVREGEPVKQGQMLASLDDRELQAELRRAQAQVAQLRTRLRELEASGMDPAMLSLVATATRDVRQAKQRYEQAKGELEHALAAVRTAEVRAERWKRLRLLDVATQAEWEQRLLELKAARAQARTIRARVAEAQAAYRSAAVLLRHAQRTRARAEQQWASQRDTLRLAIAEAEAKAEAVQARLAQLKIHAPHDGIVGWLPRTVGEVVGPHDRVMTLMDPRELWIEAYVDGEELAAIREGAEAWVTVEGVLEEYVPARVSLVYPADRVRDRRFQIGPDAVRSPTRVGALIHPVKIRFNGERPAALRPEMVAYVWIARQ
ncbi:MAG: HlyD family efflux transporter periplasmic adaptor subunit [Nitrospirae bacterium]|nr:MAG: HlyD family efflux transporter periplasmic adaptor subunit [Nitrospirota bacterium]